MPLSRHEPEYLTGYSRDVLGGHKPVALYVADDFDRVQDDNFFSLNID